MEKEWQKLASESDDPDTKNYHRPSASALQTVTNTMNTVLAEVAANKDASNDVLALANQAIHDVNAAYPVSYAEDFKFYEGELTTKADTHLDCRQSEDDICRGRDTQNGNTNVCTSDLHPKIPTCACEVDDQDALSVANFLEGCMGEVKTWSADTCTDGRTLQEHKTDLDGRQQDCLDKGVECKDKQSEFEDAWCTYYTKVHDTCDAHTLDYGLKKNTFNNRVRDEDEKAAENQKVCLAANKVKCYVSVLSADYGSKDATTVQDCQDANYDSDCAAETTLTKPPIPEMAKCDTSTLMDGVPGADPKGRFLTGNYNEDQANRLTGALTVYKDSSPLTVVDECSLREEVQAVYPDATSQPLGNVKITYTGGTCGEKECGMCEGNCNNDDQCGFTDGIFASGSPPVRLVCVETDMYGPDKKYQGPLGCDMNTMQAAKDAYNGPLGVCAMDGDYIL